MIDTAMLHRLRAQVGMTQVTVALMNLELAQAIWTLAQKEEREAELYRMANELKAQQCVYCEGTGIDPESFRSQFEMACPACAKTPNA